MYRSNQMPPSGLIQQQPQRYSDRHRLQGSGSDELLPRGPRVANQHGAADKGSQAHNRSDKDALDDDQGIKS